MKVLAISDNVLPRLENQEYLRRTYGDAEVVVSAGDMPAPYVELVATTLNLPLLYVKGNHDTQYEPGTPGGDNLNGRIVNCRGLTFAGLEGSPIYNGEPLQYTEFEMFLRVLRLAPIMLVRRLLFGYGVDVMVTHSPPRGIHDMQDRAHRGFRSLRLLINLYRPHYFLHGHVDTWDNRRETVTQLGVTRIINVNPVKELKLEGRKASGL